MQGGCPRWAVLVSVFRRAVRGVKTPRDGDPVQLELCRAQLFELCFHSPFCRGRMASAGGARRGRTWHAYCRAAQPRPSPRCITVRSAPSNPWMQSAAASTRMTLQRPAASSHIVRRCAAGQSDPCNMRTSSAVMGVNSLKRAFRRSWPPVSSYYAPATFGPSKDCTNFEDPGHNQKQNRASPGLLHAHSQACSALGLGLHHDSCTECLQRLPHPRTRPWHTEAVPPRFDSLVLTAACLLPKCASWRMSTSSSPFQA
jgi:hypothetical protein